MSRPLVSVLIPAYNAAPWIAATLDSVLAQSWDHREIIVVDDGSTDATPEILAAYAAGGVRTIRQPRSGQNVARNAAFAASSGDLVKFLDADDIIGPDMLERQLDRLGDRRDCVASAEWARFYEAPDDARFVPEPVWRDLPATEWLVTAWSQARPMMQCAIWLIPRAVLDRAGGWDERLTLIDDFEFFTRVLVHSTDVVFAPGARLYYRSGIAGSVSRLKGRAAMESRLRSLELGTEHLLRREDSARTRRAAANMLQDFVFDTYPDYDDLRAAAMRRVRALGGATLAPDGPPGFQMLRRFIGWKLARRVERAARKTNL